jgi:hypothetical protein
MSCSVGLTRISIERFRLTKPSGDGSIFDSTELVYLSVGGGERMKDALESGFKEGMGDRREESVEDGHDER